MHIIDLQGYSATIEVWPRRRLLLTTAAGPNILAMPTGKMVVSSAGKRKSILFGSAARSTVQLIGCARAIDAIAAAIVETERPVAATIRKVTG